MIASAGSWEVEREKKNQRTSDSLSRERLQKAPALTFSEMGKCGWSRMGGGKDLRRRNSAEYWTSKWR